MPDDKKNNGSSVDSYYEAKISELKASISRLKKKQKNEQIKARNHALCILGGEIVSILKINNYEESYIYEISEKLKKHANEIKSFMLNNDKGA